MSQTSFLVRDLAGRLLHGDDLTDFVTRADAIDDGRDAYDENGTPRPLADVNPAPAAPPTDDEAAEAAELAALRAENEQLRAAAASPDAGRPTEAASVGDGPATAASPWPA